MGLAIRRSTTSCFCATGCRRGTFPFRQYWVSSFAPFEPFEPQRLLFEFQGEDLGQGICDWIALNQPFGPGGSYTLRKTQIRDNGNVIGWFWEVAASDGAALNAWKEEYFPPPPIQELVNPEGVGSCSMMKYTLPNVVFGPGFDAILEPAYPDACTDEDRTTKVQFKPLASF